MVPLPRESALKFTEGVRAGWLTSDLIAWADEHLIRPERLSVRGSDRLRYVAERDFGIVAIEGAREPPAGKLRSMTASHVPHLLDVARQHVIEALRASIELGDRPFVHAALLASRVVRMREPSGASIWRVKVGEETPLSEMVLALFAADALEHPEDYDQDLSVCEECGAVTLTPLPNGSRKGCPVHLFGGADHGQTVRRHHPHGGHAFGT